MADSWSGVKEMTARTVEEPSGEAHATRSEDGERDARIGKGSRVVGTLRFDGSVCIHGEVEGEVVAADAVVVRRGGRVNAAIRARRVVIEGDVTASVSAGDRIEIGPTGRLFGDVVSPRLVIHEGAVFEGSCAMAEAVRPAEASTLGAEARPGPHREALSLAS